MCVCVCLLGRGRVLTCLLLYTYLPGEREGKGKVVRCDLARPRAGGGAGSQNVSQANIENVVSLSSLHLYRV